MAIYDLSTTDEFLNLYRQLEGLRAKSAEAISYHEAKYHSELEEFRRIRNYLSHEEFGGGYPVAVSSSVNERFKAILKKMKAKAYEFGHVPTFITKDATVLSAAESMSKNGYTYLPVLESGCLVGVVTSGSMLSLTYSAEIGDDLIEERTTVGERMAYFGLETQKARFMIMGRDTMLSEAEKEFSLIRNGKRLGAIFITETGKASEKVLRILTIYDVLGQNE